jgi:hypothetical protein
MAERAPQELVSIAFRYGGYVYWDGRSWVVAVPEGVTLTAGELETIRRLNARLVRFRERPRML